jgi:hypothetical protein
MRVHGDQTMKKLITWQKTIFLLSILSLPGPETRAAVVTLITHGFSGNVTDWIIPMAQKIPEYDLFPGTNFSCYEIYFVQDTQGNYVPKQNRIGGVPPTSSDSGEIIVKLDWSLLSGGGVQRCAL